MSSATKHGPLFTLSDIIYLVLGVIFASFALKSFLVPNHFLDGGVTGISLLLHEVYHWNLGVILLVLNIPFIVLAYFQIGKHFAIRSFLTILLIIITIYFVPFPEMTHDKLFEELSMFGIVNSERDWNLLQEKFLESHHYFTQTTINNRKQKKQENLDIIKTKLKNY